MAVAHCTYGNDVGVARVRERGSWPEKSVEVDNMYNVMYMYVCNCICIIRRLRVGGKTGIPSNSSADKFV